LGKLIFFPGARIHESAAYTLSLTARWERLSHTKPWSHPLERPERLGNLLQVLVGKRPAAVLILELIVIDMLEIIERRGLQHP
jgi:hypothetical protein